MTEITVESFQRHREDHKNLYTTTKNACSILKIALTKTPGYGKVSLDVYGDKIRVSGFGILPEPRTFDTLRHPSVTVEYHQSPCILFYGTEEEFFLWLCS
jgi:hypothetical protein